uniref:Odorant-binding protein 15 n=1 Tax=Monochamus alternatus TaxID=192382 RepID=A0A1I9HZM2_MONAT|nr:odorant-binding protein 15 [Monochamus alternatus]
MKICVLFVLCTSFATVLCITEEMKAMAAALHKTCVAETGVDEALIHKANSEKVLEDDEKLKCYVKCIMTQSGCMDDDGTVDVEAIIEIIPEEVKEKGAPIIRTCGSKVGANHCENAWLTHKCYIENGPSEYFLV